ncbi:alpha-L-fucosidase [Chitinophagaceae bacterium LB-8]|uniref:alpha-L-fucosidase n=1 Tax=Paraflavisolibacter caeni TaxID=2982496 RepID=A0A9X2XTP4_9BACT|nr:alpha-L-fucosidase [Paraflavisolibacter caeni]MCU7548831.1 alpha-L-fucosidase [Paraflavisolibacter caeni]
MRRFFLLTVAFHFSFFLLQAQTAKPAGVKTGKQVLDNFMDMRFGMFIHWGPVTLRGTEIGWSRNHQVAQNDYDSLYKEFNPVLFDAESWVKTAKTAGMKYLTITAKHHDGFCLWPSAFTPYNISNTPFRKDVVGLLAKACKKYGVKFCIYYTVLDWYSTDYPLHNNGTKQPDANGNMERFTLYMKNQLKELITNYHPYMLWFDGNWESPWTKEMGADMYAFIKSLDTSVIVNNRLGKGDHKTITDASVGDYATPEQVVGKMNMEYPWESCITISKQWSWKPNDELKTLQQCLQTLAGTSGGNGNLLLNISPMPDGRIEQRQINRLQEIGNWLQKNGEAVYGTLGGPFFPDSLKASTRKGNKIYLHLFASNKNQLQLVNVPGCTVKKAFFLNGATVDFQQSSQHIVLSWNGNMPDHNCSVLVLEMDQNVENVPLINNSSK